MPPSEVMKMEPSGTAMHWLVDPQDTPVNSVMPPG
jgi:hypothetical protein